MHKKWLAKHLIKRLCTTYAFWNGCFQNFTKDAAAQTLLLCIIYITLFHCWCRLILWLFSDPFAAASEGLNEGAQGGLIHIRIQQRNRRQTLTTVQGLPAEYDLKLIVKTCKKVRIVFNRWIISFLLIWHGRHLGRAVIRSVQPMGCQLTLRPTPFPSESIPLMISD